MGDAVTTIGGRQSQVPAGTQLGRYRVVRRIASGGMCEVYLARAEGEAGFAKPVALKLVLPHLVEERNFATLLEREAKLAAYLSHPNIVQTFELGREGDELYIAMEYVHGRTLNEVLEAANGPLPLACALSIMVATCTALHTAHCATGEGGNVLGVVHRDISPSNVMVRHDGVVKVVDFGIAKALDQTRQTRTGTLKGKSGYMSPEQCRGDDLAPASDIFNLGILLYEATTGRRAFVGANIFETMNRIVDGRYKAPWRHQRDFPRALAAIIERTLADDPSDRPVSALALRHDLEEFAMAEGLTLSELVVAQWLEQRFGTPTPVDLRLDDSVVVTPASPPRSKRALGWLGTAMIGALAGTVAFVALGQGSRPGDDTAVVPPAAAKAQTNVPEDSEVEPVASPAPKPVAAPTDAPPTDPAKNADPVAPTPATVERQAPPSRAAVPRKTKRKKHRGKNRGKQAKGSGDKLFPWEKG